jgi:hypothetical protein
MLVQCPPCQWPTALDERGPVEDPGILLTGRARIGDIAVQIVAVRIDPALRWMPDYKSDVAEGCYQVDGLDVALETILEELESVGSGLEDVLGETRPSIVELATGTYMIWVMPSSFGP